MATPTSAACNLLHPTWRADCKADSVTTCHLRPKGCRDTWPAAAAVVAAAADAVVAGADANDAVAQQWERRPSNRWTRYRIRHHQNSACAVETDRPCCIDECCSRDGFDDGPIVAVESVAVVVGDVAPVVDDDAREDVAAGGDEQTTPPIQNSCLILFFSFLYFGILFQKFSLVCVFPDEEVGNSCLGGGETR